jgi:ribosomal protein S17E
LQFAVLFQKRLQATIMAGTFPSRFEDDFEAGRKVSWVVFAVASKTTCA